MKRNHLAIALTAALGFVLAGCMGGAADNTNGQVKDGGPITNATNTKTAKHSMVGVRGGLYTAAPGQRPGIPK